MKLMNELMKKIDEKETKNTASGRNPTLYEQFYAYLQGNFEKLESRDWMEGHISVAKDDLAKRADEEKYRARVKTYTSWAIGRKISENVSHYS